MRKINFKGLTTKAAGLALGTFATGYVQKGISRLGLSGMMSNVAIIAVGALGPDLLGKKNAFIEHAGDAVMVKGINALLKDDLKMPGLAGIDDDEVSGYGDYEVGDAESFNDVEVAGYVAGPDFDEQNVAGLGGSSAL